MEDAEVGQMMTEINQRLAAAEAQTQQLTHVLNQTQIELQNTKAAASASATRSIGGLPNGHPPPLLGLVVAYSKLPDHPTFR